jgi:hypothetical protein
MKFTHYIGNFISQPVLLDSRDVFFGTCYITDKCWVRLVDFIYLLLLLIHLQMYKSHIVKLETWWCFMCEGGGRVIGQMLPVATFFVLPMHFI